MHRRRNQQAVRVVEPEGDPIAAIMNMVRAELFLGNYHLADNHYNGLIGLIRQRGNPGKDVRFVRQQLHSLVNEAGEIADQSAARKVSSAIARYDRQLPVSTYDKKKPYKLEEIVA